MSKATNNERGMFMKNCCKLLILLSMLILLAEGTVSLVFGGVQTSDNSITRIVKI